MYVFYIQKNITMVPFRSVFPLLCEYALIQNVPFSILKLLSDLSVGIFWIVLKTYFCRPFYVSLAILNFYLSNQIFCIRLNKQFQQSLKVFEIFGPPADVPGVIISSQSEGVQSMTPTKGMIHDKIMFSGLCQIIIQFMD